MYDVHVDPRIQAISLVENYDLRTRNRCRSQKLCFGFYIKMPKIFGNSTEFMPEWANKNMEEHLVKAVD